MQTTDCNKFQEDLKAYADSELPLARRLQVGAHLERCASCREEVTQMERIARDLKSLENVGEVTLSPELRAKVLARLNEVRPIVTPSLPFWKGQPLLVFGSLGASLTAATVLILLFKPAEQTAQMEMAKATSSYGSVAAPTAGAAPVPKAALSEKQGTSEANVPKREKSATFSSNAPVSRPAESRAQQANVVDKGRANRNRQETPITANAPRMYPATAAPVSADSATDAPAAGKTTESEARRMARQAIPAKPRDIAANPQPRFANPAVKAKSAESKKNQDAADTAAEMAPAAPAVLPPAPAPAAVARMAPARGVRGGAGEVNEEVRIVVEVEDIKAAEQEVERLAKAAGGSLTPGTTTAESERKPVTVQIPVKELEAFRKSVTQLGKPVAADADTARGNTVGDAGGFAGGGAASRGVSPAAAANSPAGNKKVRVILVRKPTPQ